MKYIFYISSNATNLHCSIIDNSKLTIATDLFLDHKKKDEMYIIYDDISKNISFYNNISKERNSEYKFIQLNIQYNIIFPLLLNTINKKISLKGNFNNSHFTIKELLPYSPDLNNLNSLFVNNSFSNPLTLSIDKLSNQLLNYLDNEINFSIISIANSTYYEYDENDSESYETEYQSAKNISGISTSFYNISNESELFGCNIDEFFNAMKDFDIKEQVKDWINGSIDDNYIFNEHIYEESDDDDYKLTINEDLTYHDFSIPFIAIKYNNESIVIKYSDFLNSIDISVKIFRYCFDEMKNVSLIKEKYYSNSITNHGNIHTLGNLFDFKYPSINAYTLENE